MSATIRCAIIGCGPNTEGKGGAHSIAYAHAESIRRVNGAKLVAAASRSEKNVADFVKEFEGCEPYRDYREMLRAHRADLVSVCAFPPDREAMVMEAIDCGAKGVWIEKPLADNLGAAKRMLAAAERAGCRLFVNHQRRYGKPFEWWREAVAEKKIGDLIAVDVVEPCPNLLDFGPHLVDAALFAIGPKRKATRVLAAVEMQPGSNHQGLPFERQSFATVHFDDGTRLTMESGESLAGTVPALRAQGTHGFAEVRLSPMPGDGSVFRAKYKDGSKVDSPATNENFHHTDDKTVFVERACRDIIKALTDGSPTRIDAAEGYRSLEIILGIYESGRVKKMLPLPLEQQDCPLRV